MKDREGQPARPSSGGGELAAFLNKPSLMQSTPSHRSLGTPSTQAGPGCRSAGCGGETREVAIPAGGAIPSIALLSLGPRGFWWLERGAALSLRPPIPSIPRRPHLPFRLIDIDCGHTRVQCGTGPCGGGMEG